MTATDGAVLAGCPFCGGKARAETGFATAWVECIAIGCDAHQSHRTLEAAIDAWNSRPESADDALLREARDALDGVLTGMGLRPVGAGDGCHTVTVTIPSADQMNAATRALKALNAAQGQKP